LVKATTNAIHRSDVDAFNSNVQHPNALDQYQMIATRSAVYPGKGTPFGLMYAALGLAEAGEVQNKVKKAFRDDGGIEFEGLVSFRSLTDERRKQIVKELGGVLWYISAVCNEIGINLSDVAVQNLDELCGRCERGTLRGDGDDR